MCGTFRPFERLFPFSGILECLPDQTQDIASHVFYQELRQVWRWHENFERKKDWTRMEFLRVFHGPGKSLSPSSFFFFFLIEKKCFEF